jgi:ribosomal-protein-alanine N-acetyltransferase
MAQQTKSGKNGDISLTYTIRPMVKEDIGQVNEIDHEAFPTQWPPANYRQELQNRIAYYLVVYDNERLINNSNPLPKERESIFNGLLPWRKPKIHSVDQLLANYYIVGFAGIWMLADEAHVTNLAVRQDYRGKGIGELLLLSTVDLASELKASFMTLEVRASNQVAQSLYSKYGFAQMGVRKGYYLDNREDAIIMSTDILTSPSFQEHIHQLREALKKKLA